MRPKHDRCTLQLARSTCAFATKKLRDLRSRFAQLARLLVVVAERREQLDRVGPRRAVLQADDREPPHRLVAVVREQLVQQRADVVDDAGMVAREQLEREQRRAAARPGSRPRARAAAARSSAEAKLADRAVGDRPLAKVGRRAPAPRARRPTRAQLRELALVALLGELRRPGPRRRRASSALRIGRGVARRRRSPTGG